MEAAEGMTSEMDGEAAQRAGSQWIVDGARTAELLAAAASGAVSEQFKDLLHGDGRSQSMVIDAGHGPRHAGVYGAEGFGLASMRRARWARYDLPSSFNTMAPSTTRSRKAMASGGSPRYSSQVSKSTLVTSAVLRRG